MKLFPFESIELSSRIIGVVRCWMKAFFFMVITMTQR
jgi:hypothetical protein